MPLKRVVGRDPIPFEKWVEITQAQSARALEGVDSATVLASYGLTATEWATIGAWWTQKLYANATLMGDYDRLCAHYKQRFT